jgi:hypothetical protein
MPAKIARLATRPPFWIPEVSVAVRSSRPSCSKAEKHEYSWQIGSHPGGIPAKPSWYAISTEDRTISPELERFMADRMKAKTIEVKASHLSLISRPHKITNLILNAAGHGG